MAVFNHGIFSKAKNKLGGAVFQQYEGMQVGREYNKNVKNPNTDKQIAARAKFKLASQLVALFEPVLLIVGAKISIYTRRIRGAFVGAVSRAATYEAEEATIKLNELSQAVNQTVGFSEIPTPTISGTSAQNATINATSGDVVTYKVVAYDRNSNILGTRTETFTSNGTAQAVVVPITSSTPDNYDIIAVAIRALTENGAVIYSNIDSQYMVEVTRLVASGDVDTSNIVAVSVTQS